MGFSHHAQEELQRQLDNQLVLDHARQEALNKQKARPFPKCIDAQIRMRGGAMFGILLCSNMNACTSILCCRQITRSWLGHVRSSRPMPSRL